MYFSLIMHRWLVRSTMINFRLCFFDLSEVISLIRYRYSLFITRYTKILRAIYQLLHASCVLGDISMEIYLQIDTPFISLGKTFFSYSCLVSNDVCMSYVHTRTTRGGNLTYQTIPRAAIGQMTSETSEIDVYTSG